MAQKVRAMTNNINFAQKHQIHGANTNTNNYDRKKCLPSIFKEELKHIFDRLSSSEILSTCQRGLTQNQNESLNSVVWARCPKRLFCGVHRYKIAVCDAVSQFSDGVQRKYYLFKTLNLTVGDNTKRGLSREQRNRLNKAANKVSAKYKRRLLVLRQQRKNTKKAKLTYLEISVPQ